MVDTFVLDKVQEVIEDLERTPCCFWACPGPDEPFEDMMTCLVCSSIQTLREVSGRVGHAAQV